MQNGKNISGPGSRNGSKDAKKQFLSNNQNKLKIRENLKRIKDFKQNITKMVIEVETEKYIF